MTAVLLYAGARVKRYADLLCNNSKWIYLGKDLAKREVLGQLLGEKSLLPLGDRLHIIAERLRQPFLDFIADLGKIQKDQLGWWSSSCSWKSSAASDLFLLICYEHLVGQLAREWKGLTGRLIVVIEDPWLFRQLKDAYQESSDIEFQGTAVLWMGCAKSLLRGYAARTVWTIRLVINYLKQRWFWKLGQRPDPSGCVIALYSHPQTRSLSGSNGWADPYFGTLDSLLENAGYSTCRFSPPYIGGFEQALAQRSSYFRPLILYLTALGLIKAVSSYWHPAWPTAPMIGGLPIHRLLLREWWQDASKAASFTCLVFFECMRRFLNTERLKLAIYPYENQPWEKMLVLASRASGVATLGYQHGGGLARFMLSYFYGHGEAEWAPLPDLIVTSGPYSHKLLAAGGTPSSCLVLGGSLRYQHLSVNDGTIPSPERGTPVRVLVALPIERDMVQHLVYALLRAFPDAGPSDGIEFLIKPHPMCPLTQESLRWPARIVSWNFEEAVRACAIVLYSGTTTGLEALVMGRRVIRFRSELLLNMDRADFLTEDEVVNCTDHDMRMKILSVLREEAQEPPRDNASEELLSRVFPPVDTTVWLQAINRLCQRTG